MKFLCAVCLCLSAVGMYGMLRRSGRGSGHNNTLKLSPVVASAATGDTTLSWLALGVAGDAEALDGRSGRKPAVMRMSREEEVVIEGLRAQLESAQTEIARFKERSTKKRRKKKELGTEVEGLRQENESLQVAVQLLRKQVGTDQDVSLVRGQLAVLRAERDRLAEEVEETAAQILVLRHRLAEKAESEKKSEAAQALDARYRAMCKGSLAAVITALATRLLGFINDETQRKFLQSLIQEEEEDCTRFVHEKTGGFLLGAVSDSYFD